MISVICFLFSFLVIPSVSVPNQMVAFNEKQLKKRRKLVDPILPSQKSLLLCNPDTAALFSKFFLQRWMDAKTEIGFLTAVQVEIFTNTSILQFCNRIKLSCAFEAVLVCIYIWRANEDKSITTFI
jgi:hypothetical protein